MPGSNSTYRRLEDYRLRVLLSMAAALLLLIACVEFWPAPIRNSDESPTFVASDQEVIEIEEVQPTLQARQAPPPPAPPIPVEVPNDAILEEHDLDLSDADFLEVENPGQDETVADGPVEGIASAGPTVGPKAIRFVEPEYTSEARRRRVRAEVVVEVFVDDGGRVLDTRIEERFLLEGDGTARTPVAEVGFGLEEAALSAAKRWIFRPARENGSPVSSYTTLTFTFGV